MSLDEIYGKMAPFITKINARKRRTEKRKTKRTEGGINDDPDDEKNRLYLVSVDVERCFDTIQQDKLLDLVEGLLDGNEYRIQKYSVSKLYNGKICTLFPQIAPVNQTYPSLLSHAQSLTRSGQV